MQGKQRTSPRFRHVRPASTSRTAGPAPERIHPGYTLGSSSTDGGTSSSSSVGASSSLSSAAAASDAASSSSTSTSTRRKRANAPDNNNNNDYYAHLYGADDARSQQILLDEQVAASLQRDEEQVRRAPRRPATRARTNGRNRPAYRPQSLADLLTQSMLADAGDQTDAGVLAWSQDASDADRPYSIQRAFHNSAFGAFLGQGAAIFQQFPPFRGPVPRSRGSLVRDALSDRTTNFVSDHVVDALDYEALLQLSDQIGYVKQKATDEEIIARLPVLLYTEGMVDDPDERQCSICLEAYSAGDVLRKLPCLHAFHETCILPWLKNTSTCPVCRLGIDEEVDLPHLPAAPVRTHKPPNRSPRHPLLPSSRKRSLDELSSDDSCDFDEDVLKALDAQLAAENDPRALRRSRRRAMAKQQLQQQRESSSSSTESSPEPTPKPTTRKRRRASTAAEKTSDRRAEERKPVLTVLLDSSDDEQLAPLKFPGSNSAPEVVVLDD